MPAGAELSTGAADHRLAGSTIVVAGAGGAAGHAVCAALTSAGAHVVAVGSRAESLAGADGNGVDAAETAVVDLADPVAVAEWAAELRERRPSIDGVLHLVGGWRGGSAHDGIVLGSGVAYPGVRRVESGVEVSKTQNQTRRVKR